MKIILTHILLFNTSIFYKRQHINDTNLILKLHITLKYMAMHVDENVIKTTNTRIIDKG